MASPQRFSSSSLSRKNSINPPPPSTKSQVSSRTCLCSPTNHPGSFRCSRHKNPRRGILIRSNSSSNSSSKSPSRAELIRAGRKAKSVKAVLMQIISPSCRDLHRRRNFRPTPSRLCVMNN
ncbi:hypothetical protein LUZ60_000899 [Juncus effusus]|nr:hypothetical protein LUZ60_000899 [Juncus effusus]